MVVECKSVLGVREMQSHRLYHTALELCRVEERERIERESKYSVSIAAFKAYMLKLVYSKEQKLDMASSHKRLFGQCDCKRKKERKKERMHVAKM